MSGGETNDRRRGSGLARRWEGLNPTRAIVLAVVVSVIALTLAVPLRTYFSQRSQFEQVEASNSQLEEQVADYQRKVQNQDDPAYVKAQARSRLNFVMPGDKPLVLEHPQPPTPSPDQQKAMREAANPWYSNLLQSIATPAGS
ncbi:FtsB family cell division protein [Williamsia sterculiae]|uniref:Cell division protein FtsB n=1 Tax=Williamsia sterculiae TaxID=1344003 RepID=A0A1N7DQ50_9NOCA|nr:septum formation initiator family protein [Williamsia sterculiae]SIR77944.1 Cell division protein FtsB [Williamsia sterculiae]